MARADFYVLSQDGGDAKLRFACRLAEKAVEQGKRVYLQTTSLAEAQRLDDLLWTYSERSFLPHEIVTGAEPSHPRVMVLIGTAGAPPTYHELLINLTNSVPPELESYERIAEIVETDAECKRLSRERYKVYRERGFELESHNV